MPLHGNDKMGRGRALQRFDDPILRTSGYNAQSVASRLCGLVMTRVDRDRLFPRHVRSNDAAKRGARVHLNRVRDCNCPSRFMVDLRLDML